MREGEWLIGKERDMGKCDDGGWGGGALRRGEMLGCDEVGGRGMYGDLKGIWVAIGRRACYMSIEENYGQQSTRCDVPIVPSTFRLEQFQRPRIGVGATTNWCRDPR